MAAPLVSLVRTAIKEHVLSHLPGSFDRTVFLDHDPATLVEAGLLKKTETVLQIRRVPGEVDNRTGRRATAQYVELFELTILHAFAGRDSLSDATLALDDLSSALRDAMQPSVFNPAVSIGEGVRVEVGAVVPLDDVALDYAGQSVPLTVKITAI